MFFFAKRNEKPSCFLFRLIKLFRFFFASTLFSSTVSVSKYKHFNAAVPGNSTCIL